MAVLDEREDWEGSDPRARKRRGAKRHDQAVIQAEIRRLARALDIDLVSKLDPADAPVMDCAPAFGELG